MCSYLSFTYSERVLKISSIRGGHPLTFFSGFSVSEEQLPITQVLEESSVQFSLPSMMVKGFLKVFP